MKSASFINFHNKLDMERSFLSVTAPIENDINTISSPRQELLQSHKRWQGTQLTIEERSRSTSTLLSGLGMSDVSYTSGSRTASPRSRQSLVGISSTSLVESSSWNTILTCQLNHTPISIRNPSKAVVTIDTASTEILVANDVACELFGFEQGDFVGKALSDFVHLTTLSPVPMSVVQEDVVRSSGNIVEVSGLVVDAVDSSGCSMPVSVWVRKLANEEKRCLVAMEPVQRTNAKVTFNTKGQILHCDNQFALLFGYAAVSNVLPLNLMSLVPSYHIPLADDQLDMPADTQMVTGITKDGVSFPLSISVSRQQTPRSGVSDGEDEDGLYEAVVCVYLNISGLITVLPDGSIHSVNEHFALLLFGQSKASLIGQNITTLLPHFFDVHYTPRSSPSKVPSLLLAEDILEPHLRDDFKEDSIECETETSPRKVDRIKRLKVRHLDDLMKPSMHSTPQRQPNDLDLQHQSVNDSLGWSGKKSDSVRRSLLQFDCDKENPTVQAEASGKTAMNTSKVQNHSSNQQSISVISVLGDVDNRVKGDSAESNKEQVKANNSLAKEQKVLSEGDITPMTASEEKENSLPSCSVIESVGSVSVGKNLSSCNGGGSDGRSVLAVNNSLVNLCQEPSAILRAEGSLSGTSLTSVLVPNELIVLDETRGSVGGISQLSALADGYIVLDHASDTTFMSESNCSGNCSSSSCGDYVLIDETNCGLTPKRTHSAVERIATKTTSLQSVSAIPVTNNSETTANKSEIVLQSDKGLNLAADEKKEERTAPLSSNAAVPNVSSVNATSDKFMLKDDFPVGCFSGAGQHRDGSTIDLLYEVHRVNLPDAKQLYCVWICRSHAAASTVATGPRGGTVSCTTLDSSHNVSADCTTAYSCAALGDSQNCSGDAVCLNDQGAVVSASNSGVEPSPGQDVLDLVSTEYAQHYDTFQAIGKGAFGSVRFARRRSDDLEVVVKFIRKAKVHKDCWVDDKVYGSVPMEIFLLSKLDHPNIVRVLDVFEDSQFFEMVMEKHGSGMDLFEFIERQPHLDESLASYIFRQLVSAIAYLHELKIVHRDVKDENVIIDEHFNIRLIDFGSATFREPGKLFAIFCGTMEFCSPEVLLGNLYEGPELEMWTLGVTLYTLVFAENPFADPDEAIKAVFSPPHNVSDDLLDLISWLLEPSPTQRARIEDVQAHAWVTQTVDVSNYRWEEVVGSSDFTGNHAADFRDED